MHKRLGLKTIFMGLALLAVTACTPPSPYAKGKSAADIPSQVDVIRVKEVTMGYGVEKNGDPKPEINPSQNDQEVTVMVKRNIMSQLANYGYKVTEDPAQPADIELRFFIGYMPERWPLVGRMAAVHGIIDDTDGTTLFKIHTLQQNNAGLIGAMVGPSRDEMVSSVARQTVVKVVDEIHKGTKNNKPVTQQAAAPLPPMAIPPAAAAQPAAYAPQPAIKQ